MSASRIGKGLSNTQTKNSSGVVCQGGSCPRGERMNPPSGAQQPGRGLSKTQTRNSLTTRR